MALQRTELAESEDSSLDEPLEYIDGVNNFIFENLVSEGYNTPRTLLTASPEELSKIPGISIEMADTILDQIRKERM